MLQASPVVADAKLTVIIPCDDLVLAEMVSGAEHVLCLCGNPMIEDITDPDVVFRECHIHDYDPYQYYIHGTTVVIHTEQQGKHLGPVSM